MFFYKFSSTTDYELINRVILFGKQTYTTRLNIFKELCRGCFSIHLPTLHSITMRVKGCCSCPLNFFTDRIIVLVVSLLCDDVHMAS